MILYKDVFYTQSINDTLKYLSNSALVVPINSICNISFIGIQRCYINFCLLCYTFLMGPLLVGQTPTKTLANVIYVAYVGRKNNHMLYKYGKSHNLFNRVQHHKRFFDIFQLKIVEYTDNKDIVEKYFRNELKHMGLHTSQIIKNKNQTELFFLKNETQLVKIHESLQHIIQTNPTLLESELRSRIEYLESLW